MIKFMMMYNDTSYANITIDGLPLIIEDYTPNESFNRRETTRSDIMGGTVDVIRTNYICRDFTFNTHVRIDPRYPDVYDDTFKLWMSKNVEVVCKEFGGKFNAECIVKRTHETPTSLGLEIQVIEIPDRSNIPGDNFKIPHDKITSTKITSKKKKGSSSKSNKKSNNKNKKKGGNITKTK